MAIGVMLAGLALFIGSHLVSTRRAFRARLIARIGEGLYKGLFSLVSAAGLVLTVIGFAWAKSAGEPVWWHSPAWTHSVAVVLMVPASIALVAAYIPGHIRRILKHPMLTGVILWAFVHLLASGARASVILFGAFLAWAVYDRVSLASRADSGGFAIPDGGWKNDLAAVLVGTLVYLALGLAFHPAVIGVPVFGG